MSMITQKVKEGQPILGFILWLVWIVAATLVLGGIVYLFVGGSRLFTRQVTTPIIAYRQVDNGNVTLSGSLVLSSACEQLHLESTGDTVLQELSFTSVLIEGCSMDGRGGVPETFFIEFRGDEQTLVQARVDGIKRNVIIK